MTLDFGRLVASVARRVDDFIGGPRPKELSKEEWLAKYGGPKYAPPPQRLYTEDFTQMEIIRSIVSAEQYDEICEALRGPQATDTQAALDGIYESLMDCPQPGLRGYPGRAACGSIRYINGSSGYIYVIDYDLGLRDGTQKPSTLLYVGARRCRFRLQRIGDILRLRRVDGTPRVRLDLAFRVALRIDELIPMHSAMRTASDDFFDSWGHLK